MDTVDKLKDILVPTEPLEQARQSAVHGELGTLPAAVLTHQFAPKELPQASEITQKADSNMWDVFVAKAEKDGYNWASSTMMEAYFLSHDKEPGYNVYKDPAVELRGKEFAIQYADTLDRSLNSKMTKGYLDLIDRNERLTQTISNGGGVSNFMMDMGIGLSDPRNYIPLATLTMSTSVVAKMAAATASGAAIGYGTSKMNQFVDPTLKESDARINSLATGVLSGAIVGIGSMINPIAGVTMRTMDELLNPPEHVDMPSGDAGSMFVPGGRDMKGYGYAQTNPVFNKLSKIFSPLTPENRVATSTLDSHKYWLYMHGNTNLYTERAVAGLANDIPLESQAIIAHEANWTPLENIFDDAYAGYKKSGGSLSASEFQRMGAIGVAKRQVSENPFIAKYQTAIKTFFKTTGQQASDAGLLDPEKLADYTIHQQWDPVKLLHNTTELLNDIKNEISLTSGGKLTGQELDQAALGIQHTLLDLGQYKQVPSFRTPLEAAGLKNKTLHFSPEFFDKYGTGDIMSSWNRYSRDIQKQVTLQKYFRGEDPISVMTKDIDNEVSRQQSTIMSSEISDKAKNKAINDLMINANTAKEDLSALHEIFIGKYDKLGGTTGQVIKGISDYEYVTRMGMQLLANTSDIPRALVAPFSKTGLMEDLASLIGDIHGSLKVMHDRKSLKFLGAFDSFFDPNSRVQLLGDSLDSPEFYLSKPGKITGKSLNFMARAMGAINGMNPFQNGIKSLAAENISKGMLNGAAKLVKGTLKDGSALHLQMKQLGLDHNLALQMIEQFKKHRYVEGGYTFSGLENWDTPVRMRVMSMIRNNLTSNSVFQPGGSTRPLFMSKKVGALIMKFQGFAYASLNRGLLSGAQRMYGLGGEIAAKSYIITMGGLVCGALQGYSRDAIKGNELDFSPQKIAYYALTNSPGLSLLSNYSQLADKFGLGLAKLLDIKDINNKYTSMGPMQAVLSTIGGPAANHAVSGLKLMQRIKDGKLDAHTMKLGWSLLPYNNLIWYNPIMQQILATDQKYSSQGNFHRGKD